MGINQIRREILFKGFANTTDIQKFLNVSYHIARRIREEIEFDVKKENKKVHPVGICPIRLLPYLGITEKKIIEYAEIEEKEKV